MSNKYFSIEMTHREVLIILLQRFKSWRKRQIHEKCLLFLLTEFMHYNVGICK